MNRFYIFDEVLSLDTCVTIRDPGDLRHMNKVLRLGLGDQVELCDGQGRVYVASLVNMDHEKTELKVEKDLAWETEMPCHVVLFQGVPKSTKWDFLIQKSVECGVSAIYPVQMMRSVSQIGEEKAHKKVSRWQKISDEAAKQSKRTRLPVISEPLTFKEALKSLKDFDLVLIAYEDERQTSLKTIASTIQAAQSIALVVGPEGGIDPSELDQLKVLGQVVTLGKRILRTETAPLVILSQLSYILES